MSEPIAIGILSTAHVHTDAYADHLADLEDVDFVGIADEEDSRGRETAARYDVEYLPTGELLERIDAAVVCSANAAHLEWIEAAVDAGVAVLCEKPLAATREQAARIAEVVDGGDVVAGLVMPMRFNSLALETKADYDAGVTGDLRYVTGTNRGKMPGGWFVNPERSGGGAITDHTVHILNLVRWITGKEVTEVYAKSGTHFHDIPVEDVCLLSMTLEDGTPFTLDGSWSRPDNWDTWGDATLELLGTDGVIGFDPNNQTIKHANASGDAGVQSIGYGADSNRRSLRDFIGAVRERRDPRSTVEDGLREMAVIEAAYESVKRGEPVDVSY